MKLTLKERLKKLIETLKPMTPKQRLDHLWTYYKFVLLIVAIIAALISIVYTSVTNLNREVLISGVLVNADVDSDGHMFLSDGYFEKLGGVEGDQEVQLTTTVYMDITETNQIDYVYNAAMKVIAMTSTKELDYLLMDKRGMEFYMGQDIFMDLNEMFTQEELAQWKDDLIYMTYEETGETIPVAINVQNTGFAENYLVSEDAHFIAFAANTLRKDTCRDFWDYLMAG